ncbi:MAG: class I SAM-dependent methyltransferase [Mollicutes bacterium]|nr:class I SAM-dependent methyltransferase [Mollicutes bacterium]
MISLSKDYVIDLGCGVESKIAWLLQNGNKVLATDYSDVAIEIATKEFSDELANKRLILMRFDMAKMFPIEENFTDIIIADLSLHYFTKDVTIKILNEIRRVLKYNGNLFFRVDSTKDFYFKPTAENLIEENFIYAKNYKKRFFDEASIFAFFQKFSIEDLKEETVSIYGDRYNSSKTLFRGHVRNRK